MVFRIEIKDIQAKFKLSQKQNISERNNVNDQLSRGNEGQQAVAQLMRDVLMPES